LINSNAEPKVSGAGWYDDGALASFSVPAVQPSTGGPLDLLGAKITFQGWFENGKLITSSTSGTVEMTHSHIITAQWGIDYTMPIIIFTIVGGLGLCTYFMIKHPTRKRKGLKDRRRARRARR
jgi:hypothetical protein